MDSFTHSNKHFILLGIVLSISFACHAEQHDMFFNNQIVPTVLSASKLPQLRTKAPASITVIDRELIEASGATQVADIFRLVPGMHVGQARGNFPVVAYQGLTSEFSQGVQVIIDGTSVYSPLFGGVIWSTLPIVLEDIERIEIVRGPNSVSFGANAFQSVISITTSHASQQKGTSLSFLKGDQNLERSFGRYSGSLQDRNIDYRFSLARTQSSGYKQQNDDFRKSEFSTRIDFTPNYQNNWQLSFSALDSKRQTQFPDPSSAFVIVDPKRDRNESSQFLQLRWEHNKDNAHLLKTQISYQHFDGKDKYFVPFINQLDVTGESTRWNADFEHSFELNSNRIVWGLGAVHENVYTPFRLNTQHTRSNTRLRLFGNIEKPLSDNLNLNAGALYEHNQVSNGSISPRLALNYFDSAEHGYRLIATRAFRTPVITEEYRLSFIGPTQVAASAGNLDAETVDSIELGYHGIYLNNTLNADVKLYRNKYKKLIDNSISNALFIDNNHQANSKGIEVEINYRPDSYNLIHAGYAYTTINSPTERLEISAPKHNFNALVSHKFNQKWRASAVYYNTSKMHFLGAQNNLQSHFQRLDLKISKTFNVSLDQRIDLSLSTQFALDKNIDFHSAAVADNRIYLQVGYRAN